MTTENLIALLAVILTGAGALANIVFPYLSKRLDLYNSREQIFLSEKINIYGEFIKLAIIALKKPEDLLVSLDSAAKLLKAYEQVMLLIDNNSDVTTQFSTDLTDYFNLCFVFEEKNKKNAPYDFSLNVKMRQCLSNLEKLLPDVVSILKNDLKVRKKGR